MAGRAATLVTTALIGVGGVLCLIALAQQVGFGRGYRWLATETAPAESVTVSAIDHEQFKLPASATFADIEQRPLFNDDRKPSPDVPDGPEYIPPPQVPLNVALTGVILTPDLRLAMLRDNAKNLPLALREGMPLPGDQGGWLLFAIKPRSVVFKSGADESVEVELTASPGPPKPGSKPPPGALPGQSGFIPPGSARVEPPKMESDRAVELQKRIEERRRQMREEAERLKTQNKQSE
jgi:general secretion pathway protein N